MESMTYMYSVDCPEGKIFASKDLDSLAPEWVDSPDKVKKAKPKGENSKSSKNSKNSKSKNI